MIIILRYPEFKWKAVTLSYDDGRVEDVRLVKTMAKYGLKGTFNLNSRLFENQSTGEIHLSENGLENLYLENGMEVAVHGVTHAFWDKIPFESATYDILHDRIVLEKVFHTHVTGAAYPFGRFNDDVVNILKYSGINYCRTCVSNPDFSLPTDFRLWNPTCHQLDSDLFDIVDKFLNLDEKFKRYHSPLLYIWGHSYEFSYNDGKNWEIIEKLCEKLGGLDDAWYATNGEIYKYVAAYRSMTASADGRTLYNESNVDLYLTIEDKNYILKANSSLKID